MSSQKCFIPEFVNSPAAPPDACHRCRVHGVMFGFTLAVTAIAACLWAMSRTYQDPVQERTQKGGFGSAEEAFDVAGRTIQEYVSFIDSAPVRIDSQFRATLHSKSKLWTIKGYASCPKNDNRFYRWTVILNYHDMQEWEVLAKIVTPDFVASDSGEAEEGVSQAQGELFQSDGSR
jgi:hypothetical protein